MFFDVLVDTAGEAPGPGRKAEAARDPAMIFNRASGFKEAEIAHFKVLT
jgi:hypothetical protein